MRFSQAVGGALARLNGKSGPKARFEAPVSAIATSAGRFGGWVASVVPIDTIVLTVDGRSEIVTARTPRPDVLQSIGLPHAVGWEHILHVGPATVEPRRISARLSVNGHTACARHFISQALAVPPYPVAPDLSSSAPTDGFLAAAQSLGADARVLEIGTKQAVSGSATHWFHLFPRVARPNYVMADIKTGADVDVVADLHRLPSEWTGRFDAVVANAVFEHLERPWIAAGEVARVLAPGGICHIGTHQTFPIHGYPSDFFRFSTEALALIVRDAGLTVRACHYGNRTSIVPPAHVVPPDYVEQWNATWPSYMAVSLFGQKTAS